MKENGEFDRMEKHVEFFCGPPTFDGLVSKCRDKFGWPISLRGRFDCGKERAHYVLMSLSCADEWKDYVDVVKSSSVRCLEVVVYTYCYLFVPLIHAFVRALFKHVTCLLI